MPRVSTKSKVNISKTKKSIHSWNKRKWRPPRVIDWWGLEPTTQIINEAASNALETTNVLTSLNSISNQLEAQSQALSAIWQWIMAMLEKQNNPSITSESLKQKEQMEDEYRSRENQIALEESKKEWLMYEWFLELIVHDIYTPNRISIMQSTDPDKIKQVYETSYKWKPYQSPSWKSFAIKQFYITKIW